MARQYFNGVRNLSFNGNLFSFELEDKYQNSKGEILTVKTTGLITELENAEKILQFLLHEINEIKKLKSQDEKQSDTTNSSRKTKPDKVGRKVQVVGTEHQ